MGLADDGGLLVPDAMPQLSPETLEAWRTLSYTDLAVEVLSLFTGDDLTREELQGLVRGSYATFRHPEVTPVQKIGDNLHVLELFHGPTFAFKDVALQFLGNLYAHIAAKTGSIIHILGATSGDTGASAIEGVRGKEGIHICILYPHGKVSRVQELQMTTIQGENVLNLAIRGTFDDAQRIIKEIFADAAFKREYHLRAINSINIARILAQVVYYFYAYFRVSGEADGRRVNFSVPTGNFGDIFAGYLAKQMGLPIHRLILATNENDILTRFVNTGLYRPAAFRSTHSPSMDIQVASNFERYLYYLHGEKPEMVRELMAGFGAQGEVRASGEVLAQVQADFSAYSIENEACLNTIHGHYHGRAYLLDPHTACGVAAAELGAVEGEVTVALATAHPAKFDESIRLREITQTFPESIQALFELPQRQTVVEATAEAVRQKLVPFFGGEAGGTEAQGKAITSA